MKILLAEDNAIVRKAVVAGLVANGYEVEEAEDGEQAFSLAHAVHPDMIISDVLMPNMDGYSLCQAVRTDEVLHDVPVVFYSATFLEPNDEALARLVGASGFIIKDGDSGAFQRKLRDVIESERDHKPPPYDSNPEHHDFEDRLTRKALASKLLNKITELEVEKRALRASRQFLNHVVTTIPDVVFVLRFPELEISYLAPKAERLLGYRGEELMGDKNHWKPLVDDFDLERVEQEILQAVENREDLTFTCRMRHKQGGIRWIEGRVSPLRSATGETVELFGALTDVTERFENEVLIRQNESRLNTLLGNLPGMAYRRKNYRAWNMEFVSDGAELLTGYTRDELTDGKVVSYVDLIHPQDQAKVWSEVQEALDAERQFSFVYRIMHKDGSVRWVWERGVGIDDDEGEGRFVEGFISDITLRKNAEDKLISSEQNLRALFEKMDSGLAVHELIYDARGKAVDYRFLKVNPAFERLTGLNADQLIGHSVREVLPDTKDEWIREYLKVAQSGESASFIRHIPAQDRFYQVNAFQTQQDQFATLVTDVSEQHQV